MDRKDPIFESFLRNQMREAQQLQAESDRVRLLPVPVSGNPPDRYLVHLKCNGLRRLPNGEILVADEHTVGIWFSPDYLRRINPSEVVAYLGPPDAFHPNILPPALCLGHLRPGMGLVELIFQVWQVITWQNVTLREDDALNRVACAWARANPDHFPVDTRPLKRERMSLKVSWTQGTTPRKP